MRVACPSCHAAYDVPANVVAARRRMRCARCGAEFAAGASPAPDAVASPEPTPASGPPLAQQPAPAELRPSPEDRPLVSSAVSARLGPWRKAMVLVSWVLSLLLLTAGAWAFVAKRDLILCVWPASGRIYALLGSSR